MSSVRALPSPLDTRTAALLKVYRHRAGLTQHSAGEAVGFAGKTVSAFENVRCAKTITVGTLLRFLSAYGVPLASFTSDLMAEVPPTAPPRQRATVCVRGHERTPESVNESRRCKECRREWDAQRRAAKGPRQKKAACVHGHPRIPGNVGARGHCLPCIREREKTRPSRHPLVCCGHASSKHAKWDGGRCYFPGCECEGPR
jgi:transcriptional regulator with XRE-family HTH domain